MARKSKSTELIKLKQSDSQVEANAKSNYENRMISCDRIWWVMYFESPNSNVRLFGKNSNESFKYLCRREIRAIQKIEREGNSKTFRSYRSRDVLNLYQSREVEESELLKLFEDKFKEAKVLYDFKTEKVFATRELERIDGTYREGMKWFRYAFLQWRDLLKRISDKSLSFPNNERVALKPVDVSTPKWMTLGVIFATGEMDLLLKQFSSSTAIIKHLKLKSGDNYISQTLGDKGGNYNLYSPVKLQQIYNYCLENGIKMSSAFLQRRNKSF